MEDAGPSAVDEVRAATASVVMAALLLVGCAPGDQAAPAEAPSGPTTSLVPMAMAESMIEGELTDQAGLGPLIPSCADPGPLSVGSRFGCTASTVEGAVIDVEGTVNGEGRLELSTTNLILAPALAGFEAAAATALNDEVGTTFPAGAVDCGTETVILPTDRSLPCVLTVPETGQAWDVTLTVTDVERRHIGLVVADTPRPG